MYTHTHTVCYLHAQYITEDRTKAHDVVAQREQRNKCSNTSYYYYYYYY